MKSYNLPQWPMHRNQTSTQWTPTRFINFGPSLITLHNRTTTTYAKIAKQEHKANHTIDKITPTTMIMYINNGNIWISSLITHSYSKQLTKQ
jgi:hypothetical protein